LNKRDQKQRIYGNHWGTKEELQKMLQGGEKSLHLPSWDYRIMADGQWWWVQVDGNRTDSFPKGSWLRADGALERLGFISKSKGGIKC